MVVGSIDKARRSMAVNDPIVAWIDDNNTLRSLGAGCFFFPKRAGHFNSILPVFGGDDWGNLRMKMDTVRSLLMRVGIHCHASHQNFISISPKHMETKSPDEGSYFHLANAKR